MGGSSLPLLSMECTFHPQFLQWEPFSRMQTWESNVLVKPSGRYMWLTTIKASIYTFKVLEGCRDLHIGHPRETSYAALHVRFLILPRGLLSFETNNYSRGDWWQLCRIPETQGWPLLSPTSRKPGDTSTNHYFQWNGINGSMDSQSAKWVLKMTTQISSQRQGSVLCLRTLHSMCWVWPCN